MGVMAFQLTSLRIVYSTVYLGADQRKHQISASLAFVRGIHQWPMNSPHKGPVTRKMFPFDDVIMNTNCDKTTCYIKYIKLVVQATYEEPFYTQTDKYVSYCRVIRLWRYYVQIAQDMAEFQRWHIYGDLIANVIQFRWLVYTFGLVLLKQYCAAKTKIEDETMKFDEIVVTGCIRSCHSDNFQ